MQANTQIMEDPSAEICVVCCREMQIYAVGSCDHPVCFECSARMRVLCEQNECPICRGDMAYVMFTHKKQSFSSMCNFPLMNKKYMIRFEDQKAKEAFEKLLEHNCESCEESFDNFKKLEIHVRRQHKMQFCDLCVGSLKIFTFERKVYSRTDLALHKRQGDSDDTSFRGHPLCKFCQTRFVDHDEQFRHMRREHFFCHFCDADGIHQYYCEYSYLKDHFRKDHFLCEEGECAKEQQFISSAFRNKLDLQAHKALKHSRNKTKAEAKQARTLDFEFSFAPRSMQNGERSPNHNDSRRGRHKGQLNQKSHTFEEIYQKEPVEDSQESQNNQMKSFNTCAEEFPTLSGESRAQSNNSSSWLAGAVQHRTLQQKRSEDFPALTSLASGQDNKSSRSNHSFQQPKVPKSPWTDQNRIGKLSQPSTAVNTEKNKSSQWTKTKVTKSEEEFPRLETKKVFQNEVVPKEGSNHQKSWPVNLSNQTAEQLGQEIYEKCRSKKKKKNVNNLINRVSFEDKIKPQPNLTKIYGGISDQNMNGYDENQDPLQAAKAKCLMYERPKKVTDDDNDSPWHEKASFIADDFPPLETSKATAKGPPGFTAPVISSLPHHHTPPGFSTKLKSQQQKQHHHPTTSISLKSVAQQLASEDLYSDSESQAKKYIYINPPCFQERNDSLANMIYSFLEEDNNSFDRFKILSGSFRRERTTVQDYYIECLSIFGREKFHNLFTELVCLLPDICKQQELLMIHDRFLKDELKNRGAVPKDISLGKLAINTLSTCSVCMQVLKTVDHSDHMQCHNNEMNG